MRNQLFTLVALGVELILTKENVVTDGKGLGVKLPVQVSRFVTGVNSYAAEIRAKTRLHKPAHCHRQRRTNCNIVLYICRHVRANRRLTFRLALNLSFFLHCQDRRSGGRPDGRRRQFDPIVAILFLTSRNTPPIPVLTYETELSGTGIRMIFLAVAAASFSAGSFGEESRSEVCT